MSGDAYHITAPAPDGEGAAAGDGGGARRTPGSSPSEIDYINAHGTSTAARRQGRDPRDQAGLRRARLPGADQLDEVDDRPPARRRRRHRSAIASLLAIRDGVIPPTINYETPDPECDLDYVPNAARKQSVNRVALSNSFGFGGHNAVLVFGRMA